MTKEIEVTQADIDNGHRGACFFCPVANAMGRAFRCDVRVTDTHWQLVGRDGTTMGELHPLPDEALNFISRFDANLPVEPFKFTVNF